jgi:two-component system, chemotaxis family, sensor kinase CheA
LSFLPEDRGAELRALFFESSADVLQVINDAGLKLEKQPSDEELIRSVRRAVHTLKGDSAACGFTKLSEISHELEDVLTVQIAQKYGAEVAEVVLAAVDLFEGMLSAYQKELEPPSTEAFRGLIQQLLKAPASTQKPGAGTPAIPAKFRWNEYEGLMISEAVLRGEAVYNVALRIDANSPMRAAAFQLVRNVLHACGTVIALRPEDNLAAASVEIVEAALASTHPVEHIAHRCRIPSVVSDLRIEEVVQEDTADHQLLGDLLEAQTAQLHSRVEEGHDAATAKQSAGASAVAAVAESSLRVDSARIDAVMNLVGELIIGKSMLHRTLSEFDQKYAKDPVRGKFSEALAFQSRVLDELHKCVLKIRMVPVEQLFRRFPRVVRDVAKLCGKDVALEITGEHTDLDKGILDALAEPLTHIVRNAVDHGIESVDDRVAAGKPARGTISLNAFHQGTQVVLEIRDDGRGIDLAMVRDQAVRSGLVKREDADRLLEQDVLNMIFEPGFSTATEVTEISGRGIGMDVVRTVLDRLKGTVHISTDKGKGTMIQLRMPLTLASIQTLLFRVSGRLFAVPLSSVIEITRINELDIHRVDQREVLRLREQVLTLVRLSRLSKIHAVEAPGPKKKKSFVVVIGQAEKRFGLLVDSMVGEEELVIKALPGEIAASDLVSGASILGDGTVVLILNVPTILTRLSRSMPLGAIA